MHMNSSLCVALGDLGTELCSRFLKRWMWGEMPLKEYKETILLDIVWNIKSIWPQNCISHSILMLLVLNWLSVVYCHVFKSQLMKIRMFSLNARDTKIKTGKKNTLTFIFVPNIVLMDFWWNDYNEETSFLVCDNFINNSINLR